MKLLKYSSLPILIHLLFTGCKNELKLNAPYKEFPSVYALLNPNESIQMIRINKVFLGEGDANQMAKVADSVNYKAGEITVTLLHSSNSIITFKDSMIRTAEGAFNTEQRVYYTKESIQTSGTYTLNVKNNYTGNVFTATTTAIKELSTSQLNKIFSIPFYPYPPGTDAALYIDYSVLTPKFPYEIRFVPNDDASEVYKVTLRMHFYDSLYSGNKVYHYVDYTGGNIEKKDRPYLAISFRGSDIFSSAGLGLSKLKLSNDIYGRKLDRIEFIFDSSTQDYLDYLQYVAPSFNIAQIKPLYSNFKDGAALGIFTMRATLSVSKNPATTFLNAFSDNPNTCSYKFYAYSPPNLFIKGCK